MEWIKRVWWKFRYALCMNTLSGSDWKYCWYSAEVELSDNGRTIDENPEYAAKEEMSYWDE